ncbi:MAG: MFS transporter [Bacteroidetes bacterium]|nr:MFS transporter [Bacteroidota bacterium]
MNKNLVKTSLLLVSSLTVMSGATIAPSLPQMAEVFSDIPNSEFLSKLILTIPALFVAISAPFAGRFIDKYGRLKLLYVAMIVYAIAGTSGYYLNDLYQLLVGRAVLGMTVGTIMTIGTALVGDYYEGDARQKMIGTVAAFTAIGGVVFVGLGGFLADINWRAPFLVYFFALAILPFAFYSLKEPVIEREKRERINKPRHHMLLVIFATGFLMMLMFYMLPVQLPFFLKSLSIEKNIMSGLALAVAITFGAIASVLYPFTKNLLGYYWVYAVAFLLMGIGFIVVSQASDFNMILVGMSISGLGLGNMLPNSNLWVIELSIPERRGRNIGILTTAFFLGQFLSPILVQPFAARYTLATSFGISGILMVLFAIVFLIFGGIRRSATAN